MVAFAAFVVFVAVVVFLVAAAAVVVSGGVGLLGCWVVGLLVSNPIPLKVVGMLCRWVVGLLGCWVVSLCHRESLDLQWLFKSLLSWSVGQLVGW